MKLIILKTFDFGSRSGRVIMKAGDIVDRESIPADDLVIDYWIDMQWVKVLEK
jgi:hypothetical protein